MIIGVGGLIVIPPAGIGPIGPAGPASPSFISFGASTISSTTTSRYLYPWYDETLAATIEYGYYSPVACTLDRLYVRQNTPGGNGNPSVYTLLVNSVATLLSVSIPSTSLQASNLVNTVAIAQGDLLSMIVTKAASTAVDPKYVVASMRVTP